MNGVQGLCPDFKGAWGIFYKKSLKYKNFFLTGRDDWIRTSDTYVPNVALYQAELHPVFNKKNTKESMEQAF